MSPHFRKLGRWLVREPQSDILAVSMLLSLSAVYAWLTWIPCTPGNDHFWYMQVSARVAAGEVLYRDMLWIYGPLPVYVLGTLFRLVCVDVTMFSLLYQLLATVACLLTYRAARFLLSAPLALLSTVAVFLGGGTWGSGFFSYIRAYTGAVPLGAVLGLLFVVCLLSYLKSRRTFWLIAAGVATGGAFLTKPEFALACAGTGLLFLTWIVLSPASFANRHGHLHRQGAAPGAVYALRALGTYAVSTAITVGIGYGLLAYQAGWPPIWDGISGYGQAAILLYEKPPWGTYRSWSYIVSGLGVHLLIAVLLIGILAPTTIRKHVLPSGMLVLAGLGLIVLPWGLMAFLAPRSLATITSSRFMLIQEGFQVIWSPWTVLLSALIVLLLVRWLRAYRHKRAIDPVEGFYAILVVYSALVAARFYFNPTDTLLPYYTNTFFPVLVFSLAILIPQALERWGHTGLRRLPAHLFLTAILLMHAIAGFTWEVKAISSCNQALVTPRGTIFPFSSNQPLTAWADTLQYIISHTESGDAIVVLGADPGFYFLGGRKNPLRQDFFRSIMRFSPTDADEVVQRFRAHQPTLVVTTFHNERIIRTLWSQDANSVLGQEPDIVQEHYKSLSMVWQYVQDHYQVSTVIGEQWGYVIYQPLASSP